MVVKTVLYSAEWTGDLALGEAIINILCDELRKRGIEHTVEYTEGFSDSADLIPERLGPADSFQCVLVEEETFDMASEAREYVMQSRGKDLKEEALRIAKTKKYVGGEEEYEDYSRGLTETYGW